MGHEPAYVSRYRAIFPLAELAQRAVTLLREAPLKVIALGPGDGNLEVRFVQQLLSESKSPDIELVLFDISQPLLNTAYQHALDTFGEVAGSYPDDSGELPRPRQLSAGELFPAKGRRRRIYTILGNTLANLDNEPRFFRHCMSHCGPAIC